MHAVASVCLLSCSQRSIHCSADLVKHEHVTSQKQAYYCRAHLAGNLPQLRGWQFVTSESHRPASGEPIAVYTHTCAQLLAFAGRDVLDHRHSSNWRRYHNGRCCERAHCATPGCRAARGFGHQANQLEQRLYLLMHRRCCSASSPDHQWGLHQKCTTMLQTTLLGRVGFAQSLRMLALYQGMPAAGTGDTSKRPFVRLRWQGPGCDRV